MNLLQIAEVTATSWYSYNVAGFTYLMALNSHFTGPLTTVRGSSGSAHLRDTTANGGPSAIYRWQGALVFVQVRLWHISSVCSHLLPDLLIWLCASVRTTFFM